MRFLTSVSSAAAFLTLLLIIPVSQAGYRPGRPQLQHGERHVTEKRSLFDSLGSLFGKRDDCATQFGATYVDCGYDGCFQPSLGEVCCGANSLYCPEGQFCAGNYCCPNGLTGACCIQGNGCPANVSSYYTSSLSTHPPSGTTSLPKPVSTSVKVSTTSTKISTSAVAVMTTPLTTTTAAPVTAKSTSSVVAVTGTTTRVGVTTTGTSSGAVSTHSGGGVSSSVAGSGAQEVRMRMGIEGFVVGIGVVGFVAGLI